MYYYLFEAQRGPKEYERTAQIKELLSSLGIAGEMATPTPGKGVEELVAGAIAKRYSTVIAVGSIDLANKVAHALEPYDAVFGIIPTAEHPDITRLIGTSDWKLAAEQLKRRRWKPVRMGSMNGQTYFLLPAHLSLPVDAAFSIEGPDFSLSGVGGEITVYPSETLELTIETEAPRKGGWLDALLGREKEPVGRTALSLAGFTLSCGLDIQAKVAGVPVATTPITFGRQDKELKLIVGKGLPD